MIYPNINKDILITRSFETAEDFYKIIYKAGGKVIFFPTFVTQTIIDNQPFWKAINNFSRFDYLIFSSANAVKHFKQLLNFSGASKITFEKIKIICTGNKTQEYADKLGFEVKAIPEKFSARGLLEYFKNQNLKGKQVLIPTSNIAREELEEGLKSMGAQVEKVPVYGVVTYKGADLNEKLELLDSNPPDVFAFTSPSAFKYFLEIVKVKNPKRYFESKTIAAIGPTTKEFIESFELNVDVTPEIYNLENLAIEILNYLYQLE